MKMKKALSDKYVEQLYVLYLQIWSGVPFESYRFRTTKLSGSYIRADWLCAVYQS